MPLADFAKLYYLNAKFNFAKAWSDPNLMAQMLIVFYSSSKSRRVT